MIQVPTALESFIAEVEALIAAERDPQRITDGVQQQLARLLASPDFLPPEQRVPDPEHYRTHLLAIAPSRKFSVVALVWLPGQVTPIHDHICWCCVGVLEGLEHEQRYSRLRGASQWAVGSHGSLRDAESRRNVHVRVGSFADQRIIRLLRKRCNNRYHRLVRGGQFKCRPDRGRQPHHDAQFDFLIECDLPEG